VEKKKKEASDDRPKWESGICSCCSDPLSCAIGTVAPCVLFGMPGQAPLPLAFKCLFQAYAKSRRSVWHRAHLIGASVHTGMAKQLMGEEPAANGIGFCLVGIPFAAACFFREQIRVHYNIGGHAICDGCCAVVCLQCTLCQIYRQLKAKPVMRSKMSSDFSSHLYEFYQVKPPPAPGVANPAAGTPRRTRLQKGHAWRVGQPARPSLIQSLQIETWVDSVLAHNRIFRRRSLCAWRRAWPLASCDEKWGRIASGESFRNRVHTVMLADSRIHTRCKAP
jgi:Cys-rich protein (TIGR01571 family)